MLRARGSISGTLLGVAILASVGCQGAPRAPIEPAPPHAVGVVLSSTSCPVGFLRVSVSSALDQRTIAEPITDRLGVARMDLPPGSYHARVVACGEATSFEIDAALGDWVIDLGGSGNAPAAALPLRTPPARAACHLPPPPSGLLVAGNDVSVRADPNACAVLGQADGAAWLYGEDGRLVRLGKAGGVVPGDHLVAAYDEAGALVTVERRTGARAAVSKEGRAIALAPKTDVLLHGTFDTKAPIRGPRGEGTVTSLDARWPDGRSRHLSDRARTQTAFSPDGQWLAFLDEPGNGACSTMHVVDLLRAEDRAVRRVCRESGMHDSALPRFVSERHVFVMAEGGYVVVDASSGQTVLELPLSAMADPFEHGLVFRREGTQEASLWDASSGTAKALGVRYDLVRALPTGDVVLLQHRAPDSNSYDAIFVDTREGTARVVARGVGEDIAASAKADSFLFGGMLVFAEDSRFLALRFGSTDRSVFPRLSETIDSFSADGRWVALLGPMSKGTRMWHHVGPVDGHTAAAYVGAGGHWAPDRAVFVFRDGPRAVRAHFAETGTTATIAPDIDSYAVFDGGQIVYARRGDGVYVTTMPSSSGR